VKEDLEKKYDAIDFSELAMGFNKLPGYISSLYPSSNKSFYVERKENTKKQPALFEVTAVYEEDIPFDNLSADEKLKRNLNKREDNQLITEVSDGPNAKAPEKGPPAYWVVERVDSFSSVDIEVFRPTDFGHINMKGTEENNNYICVSNGLIVMAYIKGQVDSKRILYRVGRQPKKWFV